MLWLPSPPQAVSVLPAMAQNAATTLGAALLLFFTISSLLISGLIILDRRAVNSAIMLQFCSCPYAIDSLPSESDCEKQYTMKYALGLLRNF